MARIVITTDGDDGFEPVVLMEEWVLPDHFESEHFSAQFVERIGWAVADADVRTAGYAASPKPR